MSEMLPDTATLGRRATKAASPARIRSYLLTPFAEAIRHRGIDAAPVLARHNLNPADLEDAYRRVPLSDFIAFCEEAADLVGDCALGLRLGAELRPDQLGSLNLMMTTSPTLGAALAAFSAWARAMQEGWTIQLAAGDIGADYIYRLDIPDASSARQDIEHSLANICGLIRLRMGMGWAPLEVHFEHGAKAQRRQYEAIFRAPVFFEQPVSKIVIRHADLDQKAARLNFALMPLIESHLRDVTEAMRGESGIAQDAALVIARCLGTRPVTVTVVARELGLSSRSLQRRLAEEGVSFRDLVKAQRRRVAETLLGHSKRGSLTSIAMSAGYADGAVLSRAFKSWTGSAPSGYAKQMRRVRTG
ncbi:AraC family transcriptional regulator [Ancylobacter sp. WKF20]|uniref:AraC family transcriptional regulator n=1 Tax=Ancylobacter sp. WKF20 TaxID=3039801 RepID=UPI0024340E78|nr:AraC family transcriptional regulator [Ancylobacter sp. WKF20]WGD29720.1 AraC family transcriptional regulator [Ancylobacter sp. WKF20]